MRFQRKRNNNRTLLTACIIYISLKVFWQLKHDQLSSDFLGCCVEHACLCLIFNNDRLRQCFRDLPTEEFSSRCPPLAPPSPHCVYRRYQQWLQPHSVTAVIPKQHKMLSEISFSHYTYSINNLYWQCWMIKRQIMYIINRWWFAFFLRPDEQKSGLQPFLLHLPTY